MTRDELIAAYRANRAVPLPWFGGAEVELYFEEEDEFLDYVDPILRFLSLGEADRPAATPHVFAYFKDFADDVEPEWIEDGMAALTAPTEEIWRFVYPTTLIGQTAGDVHDPASECRYVMVEGNCGWEQEHGIMLAWREGIELARVSSFDGHATNAHAYDDPARDAFIYCGVTPAANTLRQTVPPNDAN